MRKLYVITAFLLVIAGGLLWLAASDLYLFTPQAPLNPGVIYVPRQDRVSTPDPTWPDHIRNAFEKSARFETVPQSTAYDMGNGTVIFYQRWKTESGEDVVIQKVHEGKHAILFAASNAACGSVSMATTGEGFMIRSDTTQCSAEGTIKVLYHDRSGEKLGEAERIGSGMQLMISERDGRSYAIALLYGKSDCTSESGKTAQLLGVSVNGIEYKFKRPKEIPCLSSGAAGLAPGMRSFEFAGNLVRLALPLSGQASLRLTEPLQVEFSE